jgi:hypothetical protein
VTKFRFVTASNFDFSSAKVYRKTAKLDKSNIEISDGIQVISTIVNGKEETRNVADNGDYIITGFSHERYVIKASKFPKLYEEDPEEPDQYRSRNVVRAIQLTEAVEIEAPWGEIQRADAGGRICQSVADETDVYLIEKQVFENTYAPETSTE